MFPLRLLSSDIRPNFDPSEQPWQECHMWKKCRTQHCEVQVQFLEILHSPSKHAAQKAAIAKQVSAQHLIDTLWGSKPGFLIPLPDMKKKKKKDGKKKQISKYHNKSLRQQKQQSPDL